MRRSPRVSSASAILDWDVHHGNGTQDLFVDDPRVLVISLHQSPLWPGTGGEHERGSGAGAGATVNITFPAGTGPAAYLARFTREALPALELHRPELVLVSCGFDAHRNDPLAGLALEDETYGELARAALDSCRRVGAAGPVVLLEGGYDLDAVEHGAREVVARSSELGSDPLPVTQPVSRSTTARGVPDACSCRAAR